MNAQQPHTHDALVARLAATQHDGRTANVRYRQDELQSLHSALVESQRELQAAMRQDSHFVDAEVDVEFAMGLDAVRHSYETLDFDGSITEEYRIAKGKSNPDRHCAVGIVYINASVDFLFFSVIAPLAAAIAAGNVVMLEMRTGRGVLPPLLEKTLVQALSSASFAVIHGSLDQALIQRLGVRCISLQPNNPSSSNKANRTVAIVDRTADIAAAAASIVRARFAFGGRSVYAPDFVLVNEFVKEKFLEAVVSEAIAYQGWPSPLSEEVNLRESFAKIATENAASIVSMGPTSCVLDMTSRSAEILQSKVDRPVLVVLPCRSLEDAISFANGSFASENPFPETYLASYVFATPKTAKYVSESIHAAASFVNHLSVELLVGPAAPPTHPTCVRYRFQPRMFQFPRPILNMPEKSQRLAEKAITDIAARRTFLSQALRPLNPTGQPIRIAYIGFFEQGLLTSVAVALTPVAIGMGYAIYRATQWAIGIVRT
ncbi:hypothetical protein BDV12DRAFT_204011 [Aspergillus spectabilis]